MSEDYQAFLASKALRAPVRGLKTIPTLAPHLFKFQALAVAHALHTGAGGCFLDTGLGKTEVQLEWCRHAMEETNGRALILTPLAVAGQTKRRAERWGYEARVIRDRSEVGDGINICNYERLHNIDPHVFGAVALDEASILKSFTGKTTKALIEAFKGCRFKLVATATPAPNDHMELGNYAEYLEIMAANEMLSRWFINDTSTASQEWRLKGHAENDFWDWMASWARMAEKPSDLGDSDEGFILPPFELRKHHARETQIKGLSDGLFATPNMSATNMFDIKRQTAEARAELAANIVFEYLGMHEWSAARTSTNGSERSTHPIQSTAKNAKPPRGAETRQNGERVDCDLPLELSRKTTAPCSTPKTEHVRFVEGASLAGKGSGSISTIATRQESSEGSCVTHAISALGNSETTPKIWNAPPTISKVLPSLVLWCDTNEEQKILEQRLGDVCISIYGSQDADKKEALHEAWLNGVRPVLLTKPSIFGFGCDWSHCSRMIFVGRSYSYEIYYQAVRRCWRFGQKRQVTVDLIVAEGEDTIGRVIDRKAAGHAKMKDNMRAAMLRAFDKSTSTKIAYNPTHKARLPKWLSAA